MPFGEFNYYFTSQMMMLSLLNSILSKWYLNCFCPYSFTINHYGFMFLFHLFIWFTYVPFHIVCIISHGCHLIMVYAFMLAKVCCTDQYRYCTDIKPVWCTIPYRHSVHQTLSYHTVYQHCNRMVLLWGLVPRQWTSIPIILMCPLYSP